MKAVFEKKEPFTLSAKTESFNDAPFANGGESYMELSGEFVVMATVDDMEDLSQRSVKGFNECGILIEADGTYYQLGAFPLYNCGNMLTRLSPRGRPQYPNYKGYDFDRYMHFERRGDQLFARTSADGKTWSNMPGSPITVKAAKLKVGAYQTTYSPNTSWAKMSNYLIYNSK